MRAWRRLALAAAGLVVVAAGSSTVVALLARHDLGEARAQLDAGRAALLRSDGAAAAAALGRADASLRHARARLQAWPARPGSLLPVVGDHMRLLVALAGAGGEVVAAGRQGVALLGEFGMEDGHPTAAWRDGGVDLGPFRRSAPLAGGAERHLSRAARLVSSARPTLLLGPARRVRRSALDSIEEARTKAAVAADLSYLVPRVLGADGPRRWIVGAENLGELRGRGGYIGSLGVLETDGGRISMGPFTPTTDLPALRVAAPLSSLPPEYQQHYLDLGALASWPNVTMSPDFASGASVLLDGLRDSGAPDADGVVSTDPRALSYLLEVTGPVTVDGLAEPITAANVVDWSLNGAYFAFADESARKETLGRIAGAVWTRLSDAEGLDGRRLAAALGRALAERHMVLFSRQAEEQAVIERQGIGGRLRGSPSDYLLVLGQNLGENKMDYYLRRNITYDATIESDGSVDSTLTIEVRNVADPAATLPDWIGGPRPAINLAAGSARTYLSVFVPRTAVMTEFRDGGRAAGGYDTRLELGKRAFDVTLDVAPGAARVVSLHYHVPRVAAGRPYCLVLQNQATVRPDSWAVDVRQGGKPAVRWQGLLSGDRELAA